METEEIREKKEPKRLPVWACILLFALGLFVTFGLYSTIGFGVLSLILGDEITTLGDELFGNGVPSKLIYKK